MLSVISILPRCKILANTFHMRSWSSWENPNVLSALTVSKKLLWSWSLLGCEDKYKYSSESPKNNNNSQVSILFSLYYIKILLPSCKWGNTSREEHNW